LTATAAKTSDTDDYLYDEPTDMISKISINLHFAVSITSVECGGPVFGYFSHLSKTVLSRFWGNDLSRMVTTNTIDKNRK